MVIYCCLNKEINKLIDAVVDVMKINHTVAVPPLPTFYCT